MNANDADAPVKFHAPEYRGRTWDFLRVVDQKFVPPLSSHLRYGSLEAYLD